MLAELLAKDVRNRDIIQMSNGFRETANAWLFLAFGFVFMALSYISLPGLRGTKFTDSDGVNAYITMTIIFIIMILMGRVYFIKIASKSKNSLHAIIDKEIKKGIVSYD